jgi:uncharacterized protein (TIGR03089 family)
VQKANTIGAMFSAAATGDPTRPLLTFYDDRTDERTELSGATLANWVAKTANMIVDETGFGVGNRAAIGAPPHWQTAAIMLACATAGLAVVTTSAADPQPADVAFVHVDNATHEWAAAERYALNLHPLALPLRQVPDAYVDFNSEVRVHGDHFYPVEPVPADAEALRRDGRMWTHDEVVAEAHRRAEHLGITAGRVMVDADAYPDPMDWLLAPLAAGASIVLCGNLNADRAGARATSERVTQRLLGPVPGH